MPAQPNGASRLYPIIGDPIEYVESPVWLTRTFEERGHNGICVPMQVAEADLDVVMKALAVTVNVDGILVTKPHKFTATTFCATVAERTRLLGAVSVIRRNADGSWHGDSLPLDVTQLTSSMFVGDVVAGHGTTPFIAAAQAAGCRTATGSDMVEAVQDLMADFMLEGTHRA